MKLRKIIGLCILTSVLSGNLVAADFSNFENEQIQELLEFRFSTQKLSSNEEALAEIKKYRRENFGEEIKSKLSDEAKLTIENMLTIAEFTYRSESKEKSETLKEFLTPQFNKTIDWNKNHPIETANPYYLFSSIDMVNCTMQYLPQGQMMKYGLETKKYNDLLRNNNPDFAMGYSSSGLWYQVAPAIGGGSKTFAKECFYKAIQNATTNYEKYYANIYYSQACFEAKNYSECNKYLTVAEQMIPNGRFTASINELNAVGKSLFD